MSPTQGAPPLEKKLQDLVETARALKRGNGEADRTSRLYEELYDLAKYLSLMMRRIQSSELEEASNQIPLLTGQLFDVTRYTEEETHRILEYTETAMSNHDAMTTVLDSIQEMLPAAPNAVALAGHVQKVYSLAEENKKILMALLMALSFQDLAGQRMRQIGAVLQEVQSRILNLILALDLKTRSHLRATPPETPPPDAANPPAAEVPGRPERLDQHRVDDILKEFGF